MKNQVFKCVLLLGIALLGFGCSNDSDVKGPVKMISELNFGDASASTKTTLNGYTVKWASTDQIGIMNVNDASSNYRFKISSGSGNSIATFAAYQKSTTDSTNFLAPGTYIAYYPYKSTRYTASNPYALTSSEQNYIGSHDYMISDQFTVNSDGSITSSSGTSTVLLKHLFTLVEVNVKIIPTDYYYSASTPVIKLVSADLVTQSYSDYSYASTYYFNTDGTPGFTYGIDRVSATPQSNVVLDTGEYQKFNLFVRQQQTSENASATPVDIAFEIKFRYSDDDTGEDSYIYTPSFTIASTAILAPGDKKVIKFGFNMTGLAQEDCSLTKMND